MAPAQSSGSAVRLPPVHIGETRLPSQRSAGSNRTFCIFPPLALAEESLIRPALASMPNSVSSVRFRHKWLQPKEAVSFHTYAAKDPKHSKSAVKEMLAPAFGFNDAFAGRHARSKAWQGSLQALRDDWCRVELLRIAPRKNPRRPMSASSA